MIDRASIQRGSVSRARLQRVAVAVALIALAAPRIADARGKKRAPAAPAVRPEDDPKLAGDARAFANAQVAFRAPTDGAEVPAKGGLSIQIAVQGYALGPATRAGQINSTDPTADAGSEATDAGIDHLTSAPLAAAPFALLLVDNDGALRIDDASLPMRLTGLSTGPHLLRLVLSRPWGEVIKAPGALAMTRFWVGPRPTDGKSARAFETKSWPNPKRPLLTYVFPLGELRAGLGLFSDPSAKSSDDAEAAGTPGPASARPLPAQLALDFYLSGAMLKEHGRANKIRLVVNKRELPIIRAWRPLKLRLKPGKNRITIDLLDRRSTKVKNALNRTDRFVLLEGISAVPLGGPAR